jgi:hypothetical protein
MLYMARSDQLKKELEATLKASTSVDVDLERKRLESECKALERRLKNVSRMLEDDYDPHTAKRRKELTAELAQKQKQLNDLTSRKPPLQVDTAAGDEWSFRFTWKPVGKI